MSKKSFAALCAAVLSLSLIASPSLASGPSGTVLASTPTTQSLLAAPLQTKVKNSLSIKKLVTKTAAYGKKATYKPRVSSKGNVKVLSKTLTVVNKKNNKAVAKNKKSITLAPGRYKVTTKVVYTSNGVKKSRTLKQNLTVKQGKKPNKVSGNGGYNCPKGYPVKGNHSSSGEYIYHVKGGAYYSRTKPEECFTTPAAAEAAGYRASKR